MLIKQLLRESIALYKTEKYRQTISVCDAAIHIDETCAEAYCTKGMALIGIELYEEAIVAFEWAEQLGLKVVQIYIGKGIAYLKLGRYDAGLMACEQAIRLDIKHAKSYHIKAQLHLILNSKAGTRRKATRCLKRGIVCLIDSSIKNLSLPSRMLLSLELGMRKL